MDYELRLFDDKLLVFSSRDDCTQMKIRWFDEKNEHLLPMGLYPDIESLARWIRRRVIPENRTCSEAFLQKCGLDRRRPLEILRVSKALSLEDCYWITQENFPGTFEEYNLYDRPFDKSLASLAFTGRGNVQDSSFDSSPEFTTDGMLPKCWQKSGEKILLFKGGNEGSFGQWYEPFSEYFACQIAKVLGFNAIPYSLSLFNGRVCSVCELFTGKDFSYVPVWKALSFYNFSSLRSCYAKLGENYLKDLNRMIVLDGIICNTDRHLGNFGFLVNNRTNEIASPAPLFDHGSSLFNFAGESETQSEEYLAWYASMVSPRLYGDFIAMARRVLDDDLRQRVERLKDFEFERDPNFSFPEKRLKLIETTVRKRAKMILEK